MRMVVEAGALDGPHRSSAPHRIFLVLPSLGFSSLCWLVYPPANSCIFRRPRLCRGRPFPLLEWNTGSGLEGLCPGSSKIFFWSFLSILTIFHPGTLPHPPKVSTGIPRKMTGEEAPEKVQEANDARWHEHEKMIRMERKLQKKILEDPGPRPSSPELMFHSMLPGSHSMERWETGGPCRAQDDGRCRSWLEDRPANIMRHS